jgi:CRP/FNR family transcriptional regulator, nitrogen oxide reductase regulator
LRSPSAWAILLAMSASNVAAWLRANPVFAGIPQREIESVAGLVTEEPHRARGYVFMEGDAPHWFYVVRSGHVKIVRHSKTGKDVVLELLGPGEVFGGVAVIERRPYPASAQATEPTVVLKIPAEPMIALAERHPAFIKEMALMIGRRLRAAHDSLQSLVVDPVEARLAAALLRLAEREGTRGKDGVTLPFPLTRQSLADMTGTTVETTIRVLSRWLKDGLLTDEGGRLVLGDLPGLRARAAGETE